MTQLANAPTATNVKQSVLPNFLIVGASRSGTTTLHGYLTQHPDVLLHKGQRELQFFNRGAEYEQGLEKYQERFAAWDGQRAIGDVSPPYFFHGITLDGNGDYRFDLQDDAPGRIARHLPKARIFITLRNPVHRAYSQYWKALRKERETARSFRAAIEEELAGKRPYQESSLCWLYKNSYSVHLKRWFSLYPRHQVEIFRFEEWTKNPAKLMRRFAEAMNIDTEFQPNYEVKNSGWIPRSQMAKRWTVGWFGKTSLGKRIRRVNRRDGYPPITREDYQLVWKSLKKDVAALEDLLNMNFDLWSNG